jgi:hypothetical protein
MTGPWTFWHHLPRHRSLARDALEHVAVGQPDPTSHPGTAHRYRTCQFEWADQASPTLILPWSCTRELGHQGQHLAGEPGITAGFPLPVPH